MSKATTYKKKAISTIDSAKKSTINAAKNGVNSVTKNPKGTLMFLGVILGGYLIYKVATSATDAADKLLNGDPDIDDNVEGTGQGSVVKATITDAYAINYASQLLGAMNAMQPLYGTDEETIEKVFDKLKNEADFLKVFRMFGDKDYNGNNSPPTGIWSNLDSYKKQNLVYWLKSELDVDEEPKVYNKVKKLVNKAGFVF